MLLPHTMPGEKADNLSSRKGGSCEVTDVNCRGKYPRMHILVSTRSVNYDESSCSGHIDRSDSHSAVRKYPTVLQGQHNYAQYTK